MMTGKLRESVSDIIFETEYCPKAESTKAEVQAKLNSGEENWATIGLKV